MYFYLYIIFLFLVVLFIYVLFQLFFPTIISYPWNSAESSEVESSREKVEKVIFAGSFNPPHNGHYAMIEYLAKRYGEVIIIIGVNPLKKYDVNPENRVQIIRIMIKNIKGNVSVQVVSGYIWRYAYTIGAKVLFRGVRSWEKDGKNELLLLFQNIYGPMILGPFKTISTIFLEGKTEFNHISSSLVREICQQKELNGTTLSGLVPNNVADLIASTYSN